MPSVNHLMEISICNIYIELSIIMCGQINWHRQKYQKQKISIPSNKNRKQIELRCEILQTNEKFYYKCDDSIIISLVKT